MPTINVSLSLLNGESCQIIIKIGEETLAFQNSGSKPVNLPAKTYIAMIAGFLDPASADPSAVIEFKKGTTVLSSITISQDHFIKPLKVTIK